MCACVHAFICAHAELPVANNMLQSSNGEGRQNRLNQQAALILSQGKTRAPDEDEGGDRRRAVQRLLKFLGTSLGLMQETAEIFVFFVAKTTVLAFIIQLFFSANDAWLNSGLRCPAG